MGYRILIVDDSTIVRKMVKRSLEMSGVEIAALFEAGNGQEALALIAGEWIDIVFADIHMPVMDGIEMVQKMVDEKINVGVPIVIVSSDRSPKNMERLNALGVREYITKPFRPELFRNAVEKILGEGAPGKEAK
jgi:two-component system, chemotaxis family, chemotaxis protein CheY